MTPFNHQCSFLVIRMMNACALFRCVISDANKIEENRHALLTLFNRGVLFECTMANHCHLIVQLDENTYILLSRLYVDLSLCSTKDNGLRFYSFIFYKAAVPSL